MERQQMLPVGNLPQGLPSTGEEYLAMVREEAMKLPDWTRTTKKFKKDNQPTILEDAQRLFIEPVVIELPNDLLPTEGWQQKQLEDFERSKKMSVKKIPVQGQIQKFMIENDAMVGYTLNWNQPKVIQLLERHIEWLNTPTVRMARWIYVLLVRCDPLMESGDQHKLRELLKKIRQVRYENKDSFSLFIALTLCVSILSRVFGQRDLADPFRK